MPRKYEVVILFDPDLDDEGLKSQLERVESIIRAHAGEIEMQDNWGRRPLGIAIKKKQSAIIVLMVVSGDNTFVADLRRQLRINDRVLRVSVVKKDKFAPDLTCRRDEEASENGRSFDVVERENGDTVADLVEEEPHETAV